MWYAPKLTKYDSSAQLMGEGSVEDYQYLVGTTHFHDEDTLLYVTQKVYVGRSPIGAVILVSRAPIHKNGLVSSRADSTPVHVEDIIRMTGEVLQQEDGLTGKGNKFGIGPIGEGDQSGLRLTGKGNQSGKGPAGVRKQLGDASSSGFSASAANPFIKVGISSTNNRRH